MAVTEVRYADDFDYRMTTDERGRNTYTMRWIVDTDDILMSPTDVALGAQSTTSGFTNPLPAFWAPYQFQGVTDYFSFFKAGLSVYKPHASSKKTRWHIDGTYEPLGEGEQPGDFNSNPLSRPVQYHTEQEPFSEVLSEDNAGNPIVNAANQEFTEIPEEQGFYDVLVATKNYTDINAVIALQNTVRFSVNSVPYRGAAARHVKIDAVPSGPLITEQNATFYRVSIRMVFSHKAWDKRYLNQGFMILSPVRGLVRATDEEGKETPEPVLLATDGDILTPVGTAVGNFLDFRVRREVDYNLLGF